MKNLVPQNHDNITTKYDFIETFLYFFKEGASAERIATNSTLVQEIRSLLISNGIRNHQEIGGHAPMFARRATKENCTAFFPGSFSDFAIKSMKTHDVDPHDSPLPDHLGKILIFHIHYKFR